MAYGETMGATAAKQASVRQELDEMLSEAMNLEERVGRLNDRVEGPRPQPAPNVKGGPVDAPAPLALTLRRLRETMTRCHGEVGRLEERL